jgi:hypothetical protein
MIGKCVDADFSRNSGLNRRRGTASAAAHS